MQHQQKIVTILPQRTWFLEKCWTFVVMLYSVLFILKFMNELDKKLSLDLSRVSTNVEFIKKEYFEKCKLCGKRKFSWRQFPFMPTRWRWLQFFIIFKKLSEFHRTLMTIMMKFECWFSGCVTVHIPFLHLYIFSKSSWHPERPLSYWYWPCYPLSTFIHPNWLCAI